MAKNMNSKEYEFNNIHITKINNANCSLSNNYSTLGYFVKVVIDTKINSHHQNKMKKHLQNAWNNSIEATIHQSLRYQCGYFPKMIDNMRKNGELKIEFELHIDILIQDISLNSKLSDYISPFFNWVDQFCFLSKKNGIQEKFIMVYFCHVLLDFIAKIEINLPYQIKDILRLEINFDFPSYTPLPEIQQIILKNCQKIEAPKRIMDLAALDYPTHFADPHIEVDDHGYHFVVCERGSEIFRKTTKNLEEYIYWRMKDITSSMASTYELNHRIPNQDHRRLKHKIQLQLLKKINNNFYLRKKNEIQELLKEYPYED